MNEHGMRLSRRTQVTYIACYAMWFALCILAGWAMLQVLYSVTIVALRFRISPWALGLTENVAAIVLGLLWLGWVVALEVYLRDAVPRNRLLSRMTKALVVELLVLGLAYGLQEYL